MQFNGGIKIDSLHRNSFDFLQGENDDRKHAKRGILVCKVAIPPLVVLTACAFTQAYNENREDNR